MSRKLLLLFLAALFLRVFIAPLIWHPDLNNHIDWGVKFFEYGPAKFYSPESNIWSYTWPNQPPGTIYVFAAVRKIYEFTYNVFWKINVSIPIFPSGVMTWIADYLYQTLLKVPSIMADMGIAYLIYKFVLVLKKNKKAATLGALLFLFNPVIIYNSAVWGQTDSLINFFALLSLFFILRKKPVFSALSFALCLYIKISLLIFLPVLAILFIRQKFTSKQIMLSVAIPMLVIAAFTLPFSAGKEPVGWLVNLYTHRVLTNQLQIITANAFNLWAAVAGINEQPHTLMLGPLTYQAWGILLFLVAFVPTLYKLWKNPKIETSLWVLALTAFSSWMLLTNMHERYLYPLFPYFTILVALNRKLLPLYIGVSGINLLNLYNFWWQPEITPIKNIMSAGDRVSARILALFNVWFYLRLYYDFIKVKIK